MSEYTLETTMEVALDGILNIALTTQDHASMSIVLVQAQQQPVQYEHFTHYDGVFLTVVDVLDFQRQLASLEALISIAFTSRVIVVLCEQMLDLTNV